MARLVAVALAAGVAVGLGACTPPAQTGATADLVVPDGVPGAAHAVAPVGVPAAQAGPATSGAVATAPPPEQVPWTPGEWSPPPADVEPWGVWIPRIDVASGLLRLGLTSAGELEVPDDHDLAGWYVGGPRPGETGPAVVAGHVDSTTGPAVFARLHELRPGDVAHVVYRDRSVVTYRVAAVERYGKDAFPTQAVYGDTELPTLRLITCGGTFDRASRSYRDNVVVYATIEGTWAY